MVRFDFWTPDHAVMLPHGDIRGPYEQSDIDGLAVAGPQAFTALFLVQNVHHHEWEPGGSRICTLNG